MKSFFLITLLVLAALSAVAWITGPDPLPNGKIPLVWCTDDAPFRHAQMAPFNRENPQYHLEIDPANSDMAKIIVQSLAGVGPDCFDCYTPFQAVAYVRSGIAWDITDELAKMGIDVKKDTWAAIHPDCILDGRVYGFPSNAAVNVTWYHKDLLRQAGITLPKGPWTWKQMIPIAQKLTKRDAQGHVTQWGLFVDWYPFYEQFVIQWGGHLYANGGAKSTIDSPQCIAAIQFMHDLIYKYKVCPSPGDEEAMSTAGGWGSGSGSSMTFFGAKKGAMAIGGRWWLCRLRKKEFANLQLGAVECPCGKIHKFLGYGRATMINKNSPHRYGALKFLAYLDTEAYNKEINHDGDGVGPVKKYIESADFLHDPAYPKEDFNQIWRSAMEASVPEEGSPFIDGSVADRNIQKQLDLVRLNSKPVAAALHDAARIINDTITQNIKLSPELRARYEKLTRSSASEAAIK